MEREEAMYLLNNLRSVAEGKEDEAIDMAIEALSSEPTVIRSKTLMPTKDFKEWAKRVRENNPSVIVIPCDAEVVPVETTATKTEKSSNCGDLISRADAIEAVASADETNGTIKVFSGLEIIDMLNALPSADTVSREFYEATIKVNHGLAKENIELKEQIESADRPSGEWVRSGNTLICPICGAKGEDIKDDYCFNYCPNCGAYMRNQNNEQR